MDKGLKSILLMIIRAGIIATMFAVAGLMLCLPFVLIAAIALIAGAAGCFTKLGSRIAMGLGLVCLVAVGGMRLNLIPDPFGRCIVVGAERSAAVRKAVDRFDLGSPISQGLESELKHLKKMRDDGLITEAEYLEARLASLRRFGSTPLPANAAMAAGAAGGPGAHASPPPAGVAATPDGAVKDASGAPATQPGAQP